MINDILKGIFSLVVSSVIVNFICILIIHLVKGFKDHDSDK